MKALGLYTHTHTHTHTGSLKENKKKNIKGITLVALVVTIIILLILAGISISALTQTGLFERAKQAKEKSENAQKEENNILQKYENSIHEVSSSTRENNNFFEWNKMKINNNGKNLEYYYNNEKILPLYWYGYMNNPITAAYKLKSTDTSGTVVGRANVNTETNGYLRFSEQNQWALTNYIFNDIIDYTKYKEMHIIIKNFEAMNGSSVFLFGFYDVKTNNDEFVKQRGFTGLNSQYEFEKIHNGEFVLDISDIDFSSYEDIHPAIQLYKEGTGTPTVDIEAVYLK